MSLRRWVCFVAIVVAALNAVRTAPGAVIGADGFAPGATVWGFETGDEQSVGGGFGTVTFSVGQTFNGERFSGGAIFGTDMFGAQRFTNTWNGTDSSNPANYSNLAATFGTPQPAVGAYIGQVVNFQSRSPATGTVKVFDANLVLLDSLTLALPAAGAGPAFVGFAFPQGIARIEWHGVETGFFGVDNVTYGTAAVPEPGSLGLLGLGATAILRRGRSR